MVKTFEVIVQKETGAIYWGEASDRKMDSFFLAVLCVSVQNEE